MFLTELRSKNYSRMERKQIEGHSTSDGYKFTFNPDTPKEVLEFVITRERSAGFYWCPKHNEWEVESLPPCVPDFKPPDYQVEGGNSFGEGEGLEGETLKGEAAAEALKEFFQQQQQQGQGSGSGEGQIPKVGDKIKFDEAFVEHWGNEGTITEVMPARKEGDYVCIFESKGGGRKGGVTVTPNGNAMAGRNTGHLSGNKMGQLQQQQQPEKKWTKLILNRCKHCKTETLQKIKMPPPAPTNDWDRLDYTEEDCGCEVLKSLLGEVGPVKKEAELKKWSYL